MVMGRIGAGEIEIDRVLARARQHGRRKITVGRRGPPGMRRGGTRVCRTATVSERKLGDALSVYGRTTTFWGWRFRVEVHETRDTGTNETGVRFLANRGKNGRIGGDFALETVRVLDGMAADGVVGGRKGFKGWRAEEITEVRGGILRAHR